MILKILLFTTSIICLDLQALTPQEVQTFINNNFPNGVARNPGQGRNIGNRATQFAQELGGEYGIQVPAALRDTIIKLLKNLGGNKDSSELIQQIADGTPNSPLAAAAAPAAAPRPRPRPRPINNPSPQPPVPAPLKAPNPPRRKPPLTPPQREEMRQYRDQAMALENQYKERRLKPGLLELRDRARERIAARKPVEPVNDLTDADLTDKERELLIASQALIRGKLARQELERRKAAAVRLKERTDRIATNQGKPGGLREAILQRMNQIRPAHDPDDSSDSDDNE